ncbi:MAG: hypothetical protein M1822_000129 [Bathelium mastoideum]|nr:MAG: hypothetical protein M1822_000129 [Bathelium mastoideum]
MPETRDRDLEIPLEHPVPVRESKSRLRTGRRAVVLQQTRSQELCLLLRKLPLDLRLLIWEECVGRELLHVVREPGRLGYIICPFWNLELPRFSLMDLVTREATRHALAEWASPEYTSNHICWSSQDTDGLSYARTPESKLFGLNNIGKRAFLPLLQTCRQIYTEVLPVIYQTNVFDLKSPDALLYLPRTTIHVNLIRSLRLSWNFCADPLQPRSDADQPIRRVLFTDAIPPFDLDTWLHACIILSMMKGLQDLVVMIESAGWVAEKPESASQLLLPLTGIKVGRKFEVHVPWEANEWEEAVVDVVERQREHLKVRHEDRGRKAALPENICWARRILQESAKGNAVGKRLTLDSWKGLLKSREKDYKTVQMIEGIQPMDVATVLRCENRDGKGKAKDIVDTNDKSRVATGAQKVEQNVGFTIVRREDLLSITKLPTSPARKKRNRNKAFERS